MNRTIVLIVVVVAVSGCAPKVVNITENPAIIYVKVPSMAHPEAYELAVKECKKLHPNYRGIDHKRTFGHGMAKNMQDLKDNWLGLKPYVQTVTGVFGFHCKCLPGYDCKQE